MVVKRLQNIFENGMKHPKQLKALGADCAEVITGVAEPRWLGGSGYWCPQINQIIEGARPP